MVSLLPGAQQLSLAPGDFVTTKSLGHVTQTNSAELVPFPALTANPPGAMSALLSCTVRLGTWGPSGKRTSSMSHPDLLEIALLDREQGLFPCRQALGSCHDRLDPPDMF